MTPEHFRAIAESARFVVGHIFEKTIVIEKESGREFDLGSHYGHPKVALIALDESWFVAGGEGLTYFSQRTGPLEFLRDQLRGQENRLTVSYLDGVGQRHSFEGVASQERDHIFVGRLELLPSGDVAVHEDDDESPSVWFFDPVELTVRRVPAATEPGG